MDPAELINAIADASQAKNWALMAGLIITLVVAAARWVKLLEWLPKSAMKWVAGALAALTSVGTHLVAGNADIMSMIVTAVSTGVAAVGGWEMLLKPLLGKLSGDK